MHPHPAPHGVSINGLYPLNDTSEVQIRQTGSLNCLLRYFLQKLKKRRKHYYPNSGCYLLIARLLFLLPMGQVEKARQVRLIPQNKSKRL